MLHVAGLTKRYGLPAGGRSSTLFYLPDAIAPWPAQSVRWALDFTLGFFAPQSRISKKCFLPSRDRALVASRAWWVMLLAMGPFVGIRLGTYGDQTTPAATFGTPSTGLANLGPARMVQFIARFSF